MNQTFTEGFKPKKSTIKDRNAVKQKTNFCRASKFVHIIVFTYLDPVNIFKLSSVCRSLLKSSHDKGVWEIHFPNQRRLLEIKQKYSNTTRRELYINDMKVICNMT